MSLSAFVSAALLYHKSMVALPRQHHSAQARVCVYQNSSYINHYLSPVQHLTSTLVYDSVNQLVRYINQAISQHT